MPDFLSIVIMVLKIPSGMGIFKRNKIYRNILWFLIFNEYLSSHLEVLYNVISLYLCLLLPRQWYWSLEAGLARSPVISYNSCKISNSSWFFGTGGILLYFSKFCPCLLYFYYKPPVTPVFLRPKVHARPVEDIHNALYFVRQKSGITINEF